MNRKFIAANRAGHVTLAPLFGKTQVFTAIRTNSESVRFTELEFKSLPLEPPSHFSDFIGIICSCKKSVKPFALKAAFFDILRQHTVHRKAENRKCQHIENEIGNSVSHKRAYSVEQEIEQDQKHGELINAVPAVHEII